MTAHVVYRAGEWKKATMDGQACDRHSSARAKARILLEDLGVLYMCGHCVTAFSKSYAGDYNITYETVTMDA